MILIGLFNELYGSCLQGSVNRPIKIKVEKSGKIFCDAHSIIYMQSHSVINENLFFYGCTVKTGLLSNGSRDRRGFIYGLKDKRQIQANGGAP